MKKTTALIATTLTGSLLISALAMGDDDEDKYRWGRSSLDVAPVTNQLYNEECGDCHMAYQPGLLPARSWKKLMHNLENHFDENAELDAETQAELALYLMENAADKANYKRSRSITRSLDQDETPLRISTTRYFIRKHDELPKRLVEGNPEVKTFSRCEVCHTDADKGSYNEHQVRIPGYGRWDD
ncbi:diheme cytochrome c [Pseudomonadota bacterium]